jgi:putative DNA methylase
LLEAALSAHAIEKPPAEAQPVAKSFIETQFPVSLLSKECYKERKAGAGQTLTALGSYWKGRKPLILVRACVLGCLLPSTDKPKRDRDIFLKLMLMDEDGLLKRWQKAIPADKVLANLGAGRCEDAIEDGKWKKGVSQETRKELQERAFRRMGYDEKLEYCVRPEEMADDAWDDIWPEVNRHLGTSASSLTELVEELGRKRFGHRPRVADTFCGGGSIPFEAARMGCDVHASDLNPIAAMLT